MSTTPGADPQAGPQTRAGSNTLSIIAMVLGAIAVLVLPIVFGLAAIVLAAVAISKKEPLAKTAMIVAVAGTVLGFVVGALVYSSMT